MKCEELEATTTNKKKISASMHTESMRCAQEEGAVEMKATKEKKK